MQRVGGFVVRRPMLVIAAWVTLAAALFLTVPPLSQTVRDNAVGLMPVVTVSDSLASVPDILPLDTDQCAQCELGAREPARL